MSWWVEADVNRSHAPILYIFYNFVPYSLTNLSCMKYFFFFFFCMKAKIITNMQDILYWPQLNRWAYFVFNLFAHMRCNDCLFRIWIKNKNCWFELSKKMGFLIFLHYPGHSGSGATRRKKKQKTKLFVNRNFRNVEISVWFLLDFSSIRWQRRPDKVRTCKSACKCLNSSVKIPLHHIYRSWCARTHTSHGNFSSLN